MLTFKEHIDIHLKKAYAKTSALRRIRRFVPINVMLKLYKAFILPHLEYCSPLLLGVGKVLNSRMEDGNYYILRSILGHAKSVPYEQFLCITSMNTLEHRRICQSVILLYKCVYSNGPSYIRNFLNFVSPLTVSVGMELYLPVNLILT